MYWGLLLVQRKFTPKSSIRLLLSICLMILIVGLCMIFVINWRMKIHAQEDAREKAMIMLERNLAIHTYFSHQLKPILFKKIKSLTKNKYFEPAWMSSTYAVREIDQYYKSMAKKDYYYKECAVNARSPKNEADEFELSFIKRLNKTPELIEDTAVRLINNKPYFVTLRRGETMEQDCLRCHSTPDVAPSDMVTHYGPDRSFNRSVGEVVSAISIRIPLGIAYSKVNLLIKHLSILLGMTLLIVFGLSAYLSKQWVFDPLNTIRLKAMEISKKPGLLGEQIDIPSSYELAELTKAFNSMSLQLRKERDQLENRVTERTKDLNKMNSQLKEESHERKKIISELQTALAEIKTLRGIVPICSHCKKIRDDKGDWNKLEEYVQNHSEAKFSHGICQDCLNEHYPDTKTNED